MGAVDSRAVRAARKLIFSTLAVAGLGMATARAQPPVAPVASAAAMSDAPGVTQRDDARLRAWLVNNGLVKQVSSRTADLVTNAMSFLGVKYRWGGDSASTGFDCSGFVKYVYQETVGTVLPHSAAEQSRMGEKVPEDDLKPGDLVFFNTLRRAFSHVGIYIGNGEFIHSPRKGETVRIEKLDSPYWARRFEGGRRLLPGASAPADETDVLPDVSAATTPALTRPAR